jgi:hypothetical protein
MAETKIANVVVPEVYNDYAMERSIYHSSLYKSGIIVKDPQIDMSLAGGASQFVTPFWKDLINPNKLDEVPDEDNDVDTDNIEASEFTVRRQMRVKKWGANDMSAILAGTDPINAIQSMVENFWYKAMQNVLFATVRGVIAENATGNAGDMVKNLTANVGDDAKISSQSIIDAIFLMGDKFQEITAISMHSVPYSRLVQLNLIDFAPDSEQNVGFGTYLGKSVILDDDQTSTLETVGGVQNTPVYWTTLYKRGAFGYGESAAGYEMTEIDRNPDKGGGIDFLHSRRVFALHPAGFNWLETSVAKKFPNNTELATAANWDRAYSSVKNVGFVVLKTLG